MTNLFEKGVIGSLDNNLLNSNCLFKEQTVQYNEVFFVSELFENCILFVTEGSFQIVNDPDHERPVITNEMIFIPPFTSLKGRALSPLKLILLTFENNNSLYQKLNLECQAITCNSVTIGFKIMKINPHIQHFLSSISSYLNDNINCIGLFLNKQSELFYLLKMYYSRDEIINFFCSILCNKNDFKQNVLKNYTRDSSVSDLALKCNMSLKTFTRRFKENFGETPYQWLLKQNIREIRIKLADPNIQIKDIAFEFGFASASHFSNFCKTQMNESPQAIREKIKQL